MKKKHAARKIHARTPWTKFPGVYVAPDPWSLWDAPHGHTFHLGTPGARPAKSSAQERADAATDAFLGDPPRVPKDSAVVPVYLDGHRVRVPVDWAIALGSGQGRDQLYLREPSGVVHVLLLDRKGALRELLGIPADLIADLVAKHFPGR